MKAPRNQQRVVVKSFDDLNQLRVPGHLDSKEHVPEQALSAIAVIDNDSIRSMSQDSEGNIHVSVTTSDATHPAMQEESTMTITTGHRAAPVLTAHTNVSPFPAPTTTITEGTNTMNAQNNTAASNNQALDTRDQAQGVVRADISNDLRPDAPATTPAAAAPAKRARRLFRAEPEGNFDENYQAAQDTAIQLSTLRNRVAHHSTLLSAHDAELDDLQQNVAELTKKVEENAKRPTTFKRQEKDLGYYAEEAGTALAIGGGIMAGVAGVAIMADWLLGTNLATLPAPTNGN